MAHGEVIYKAVIPLNPATKKNSQRIASRKVYKNGKYEIQHFIIQSERYKEYENQAGWYLLRKPAQPISEPVNLRVLFYRKNEIVCDQSNLTAAIDDILVKYRILKDDNFKIIKGHDGTRVYVDRKNPRTEIYIERFIE